MKLENYTFDEKATKILEKLNSNGNKGYFVGGCLRDVLLGKTPKDIDIATNMEYNDIKKRYVDLVINRLKEKLTVEEMNTFQGILKQITSELMPEVTYIRQEKNQKDDNTSMIA